jgi:hypothetical protein
MEAAIKAASVAAIIFSSLAAAAATALFAEISPRCPPASSHLAGPRPAGCLCGWSYIIATLESLVTGSPLTACPN